MATAAYAPRSEEDLVTLFRNVGDIIAHYIAENYRDETKIVNFAQPHVLQQEIDFQLPESGEAIDSELKAHGELIQKVLHYSIRTGAPRYFNQLWSGTDVACVIAEMLSVVSNSSTYTYEVAPVYSLMEIELVNHMLGIVGYPNGDGVLTPGGAVANMQGMLCARHHAFPNARLEGVQDKKLVCFTSAHSHYTIKRGANVMGIGMNAAHYVPVLADGKMDPQALERMIIETKENGMVPFFVNATAGTTVLGVFDDLNAIADVCQRHGVWLHCDASWGGTVLLSDSHRHLMSGIERTDSVAWALSKMMGMPQQCAVFLSRWPNILKQTNASNADYLFHDDDTQPYDLGDKTINCGRRQDSFKAWFSWKVHGRKGFGERVDRNFENTARFVQMLRDRSNAFELLFEPECCQVCFFCLPPSIRHLPKSEERDHLCGEIVRIIRRRIQLSGRVLLNYNPLHASPPHFAFVPNHFRIVFANPEQSESDLLLVIEELEKAMEDISLEDARAAVAATKASHSH